MPTLRSLPSADFVNTRGSVKKRPPSFGQHFNTGISDRSTSLPNFATSWHGAASEIFLGNILTSGNSFFAAAKMSEKLLGGDILAISAILSPDCARVFAPIASAILFSLPKRFAATGKVFLPLSTTFSKSSAFPPPGFLDSASTIFEISISGETGDSIFRNSPSKSRHSMNSCKSLKFFFIFPTP